MKSFGSLEAELSSDARDDGLSTVYCEVCLREPWPAEWKLFTVLDFGAGANREHDRTEEDAEPECMRAAG